MVCFRLALVTQVIFCFILFLNMTHEVSNTSSFLIMPFCSLFLACFSIIISKLCTFS